MLLIIHFCTLMELHRLLSSVEYTPNTFLSDLPLIDISLYFIKLNVANPHGVLKNYVFSISYSLVLPPSLHIRHFCSLIWTEKRLIFRDRCSIFYASHNCREDINFSEIERFQCGLHSSGCFLRLVSLVYRVVQWSFKTSIELMLFWSLNFWISFNASFKYDGYCILSFMNLFSYNYLLHVFNFLLCSSKFYI